MVLFGIGTRALIKDNAGYQLRCLFCGAEGTLGIVTKAVLRTFPRARKRATALLVVPDSVTAVTLSASLRNTIGEFISALEFFSETGLELVLSMSMACLFHLKRGQKRMFCLS